jgi:hypothetical protein
MTDDMPQSPPKTPNITGRFRSGIVNARMTMAPEKIPAVPSPATARPTMNVVEVGATAVIKLPSSKRATATAKASVQDLRKFS